MGANVTPQRGVSSARKASLVLLLMAVVGLAASPLGMGVSTGISSETQPSLPAEGCVSCHGDHAFATQGATITVAIVDADGDPYTGTYTPEEVYTITVTLDEQNVPTAANHAGFNFQIDAGALSTEDPNVQVTGDGLMATHTNPGQTQWTFQWTAPEDGPATWLLFVNDVDGNASPESTTTTSDQVYSQGGWFVGPDHAKPGAVVEEEVHVGVPLPQYWLGLIALATMSIVLVFAYVYLKYSSPNNVDQGDR